MSGGKKTVHSTNNFCLVGEKNGSLLCMYCSSGVSILFPASSFSHLHELGCADTCNLECTVLILSVEYLQISQVNVLISLQLFIYPQSVSKMAVESAPEKALETVGPPSAVEEGEDARVAKKKGTIQDRQDMWRIGREQELNVSFTSLRFRERHMMYPFTDDVLEIAKFSISLRAWFYRGSHVYMGSCDVVRGHFWVFLLNLSKCFFSGSQYGLLDGSAAGMIYTYVLVPFDLYPNSLFISVSRYIEAIVGFSAVILSMAEMASM